MPAGSGVEWGKRDLDYRVGNTKGDSMKCVESGAQREGLIAFSPPAVRPPHSRGCYTEGLKGALLTIFALPPGVCGWKGKVFKNAAGIGT